MNEQIHIGELSFGWVVVGFAIIMSIVYYSVVV